MTGNTVFISGASRGIGRQTVLRFARAGYRIGIGYHTGFSEAEETARECERLGAVQTLLVRLDLADDQSIAGAAAETVKHLGKVSILVNCAGVLAANPLAKAGFAEIGRQLRINLEGQIKLTREFLPAVQEAVINVGSSLGLRPKKNLSIYVASKFGIRGFTKSLAREMPQLRVYAVNPGLTATQMGNFEGMDPAKVAEVIFQAATGALSRPQGSDINVWYEVLSPLGKVAYRLKRLAKIIIGLDKDP